MMSSHEQEYATTAADTECDPEHARALTDKIKVAVEGIWHLITEAYTSRAWAALGYSSWDDYCTREFGTSRLRLPREERQEVVASLRESGLSIRAIASATGDSRDTVHKALGSAVRNLTPDPESAPVVDVCPHCGNDMEGDQVCAGCYPPAGDLHGQSDDAGAVHPIAASDPDDDPPLTEEECEALADPDDLDDEPQPARVTGSDGKSYPASKPSKPRTNRKPITDAFWSATYDLGKKVTTLVNLAADDRFTKNADQIRDRNLNDLIRARDALQGVIDQLDS